MGLHSSVEADLVLLLCALQRKDLKIPTLLNSKFFQGTLCGLLIDYSTAYSTNNSKITQHKEVKYLPVTSNVNTMIYHFSLFPYKAAKGYVKQSNAEIKKTTVSERRKQSLRRGKKKPRPKLNNPQNNMK